MPIPSGSTAVMACRTEPPDSLDDFPTPPWGTRALYRYILPKLGFTPIMLLAQTAWEPAANRGLMAEILREHHADVFASDVHDYGRGYAVGSFTGAGFDAAQCPFQPDWVITNPPFKLAAEFVERAVAEAKVGAAMLLRTAFLESAERYELFRRYPLTTVAPFSGRLAMVRGGWDPEASSATSYAWFVFLQHGVIGDPRVIFIPPEAQAVCTEAGDRRRFAVALPEIAETGALL